MIDPAVKEGLVAFEVSSPEELRAALDSFSEKRSSQTRFAELRIYGSGILVRQFELPNVSLGELKNALKLEATEIFSLPPQDIELDYKIFSSSEHKIKGMFLAIPNKLLQEYLSCFDATDIIPVKMTANIIAVAGDFLLNNRTARKSFCLVDFSKTNIINMTVFINGQCELLREIYYDGIDDAEEKVINSLKYIYGKSASKRLNKIYYSGDLFDKDALVLRLQEKIDVEPESGNATDRDIMPSTPKSDIFFKINLFKKYVPSLPMRNGILRTERVALTIFLLFFLILGAKTLREGLSIRHLRSSFSRTDYDYARSLQEKVNLLSHGK